MQVDNLGRPCGHDAFRAQAAALEAKDAEIASLKEDARASGALAAENFARAKKAEAEIAKLRDHLKRSLRQWSMYAEMVEGNDGFDLATEQSPEGEIYREAHAVANEQRVPQIEE
jgi:hypothetical protein